MNKLLLLAPVLLACLGAAVIACGGGDGDKELTLGSLKVIDHGTKDATGATSLALEANDFYFEPTFLRGSAGQKLKLTVTNQSNTIHNISVSGQPIDKDIAGKGKIEVDLTFPQSGVLLFLCKYHTAQGMNGELLVGNAEPQASTFQAPPQPTVKVVENPTLGKFLSDPAGKTLYLNRGDVAGSGVSTVSGRTAETWPPLTLVSGSPIKAEGLSGDLTLINRDDGTKQVTYKRQPLYYFARDANPGDTNGQAVGGTWFVVAP